MTYIKALLMHKPEVMKRVQEELSDIVGINYIVEESHLPKLLFLDTVMKETLRLHTALPLLVPRSPNQSCIVGEYTIPEGTKLLLNVWAMHRESKVWDNPSEFRPEKFLGDHNKWDYTDSGISGRISFRTDVAFVSGTGLKDSRLKERLSNLTDLREKRTLKLKDDKIRELEEQLGNLMVCLEPVILWNSCHNQMKSRIAVSCQCK
ncbi:unnamed protein product [Camellia sinensis]